MTDEKVDVVDKWIAGHKKTGYPIAILDGKLEEALGVPHFPYNGVIDPEGNIVYAGNSPESAIKKAMKSTKSGSIWPKKLSDAAEMVREGKLAEAWAELQKLKGLDEREQAVHEKFSTYITEVSADSVKSAAALFKKDMVWAAMQKVEGIAKAQPELPATPDAAKLVEEMKAVPRFDDEMKGGELYAAAVEKEDADEFLDAVNALKNVDKKFEGTKIAALAMDRARDLVDRGMPGYAPTCEKCKKRRKACDKHAKTVKL